MSGNKVSVIRKVWRAPQLKVIGLPVATLQFNGGEGDGNTGS